MTLEKLKKTADKLKKETKEKKVKEEKEQAEVKKESDDKEVERVASALIPGASAEMLEYFKQNADMGADDINDGTKMPFLSIIQGNTKIRKPDGSRYNDGLLYHTVLEQAYESLDIHILRATNGFYSEKLNRKPDSKPTDYHHFIGAVIAFEYVPLVIDVKSTNVSDWWEFRDAVLRPIVKPTKKEIEDGVIPIPRPALTVRVTSKKETDKDNEWYNFKFELIRHEEDNSLAIVDLETLKKLEAMIPTFQDMFDSWLARKETDKQGNPINSSQYEEAEIIEGSEEPPHPAEPQTDSDDVVGQQVNVDDIPF